VEDLDEALLCGCRALEVLDGADFLGLGAALLFGDRTALVLGLEALQSLRVCAEVELSADEDDGGGGAVVLDLRDPLGGDVLKGGWADDAEADEEDIGLGIAQRTKTVIVLLAGSIPEAKVHSFAVNNKVGTVVVKNSWNVLTGESISGKGDEKARLADCTITYNNTFNGLHVLKME